jgi:hypothetical protein
MRGLNNNASEVTDTRVAEQQNEQKLSTDAIIVMVQIFRQWYSFSIVMNLVHTPSNDEGNSRIYTPR